MIIDNEDYAVVRKIVEELKLRAVYLTDDLMTMDNIDIPTRMAFNAGQLNQVNSLLQYINEIEESLNKKQEEE